MMPYNCGTCEKENDPDWFKPCQVRGEFDFVVTHMGEKQLDKPFIAAFSVSRTSVDAFNKFVAANSAMWNIPNPSGVVTELTVVVETPKNGSGTYERLDFAATGPTNANNLATINKLYGDLKTALDASQTQQLTVGTTTEEASASEGSPF
jgi:hypothetical protein